MIINFILFVKLLCQIVCVIEIFFKIVNPRLWLWLWKIVIVKFNAPLDILQLAFSFGVCLFQGCYLQCVDLPLVTCFILLYNFLNIFPFINWVFAHLRSANLFFIYMTPPVKSREIFQPQICCIIFDTYFATNMTMYQYKMYLYTHIHITYIYVIYKRFLHHMYWNLLNLHLINTYI